MNRMQPITLTAMADISAAFKTFAPIIPMLVPIRRTNAGRCRSCILFRFSGLNARPVLGVISFGRQFASEQGTDRQEYRRHSTELEIHRVFVSY